MARASKEEKRASKVKIVNEAARLLKEKGIESTGVAEVMGAAGLTHGGFYRHFRSKNDLVCAAISKAFGDIVGALERDIEQYGAQQAIHSYIKQYLSEQHVGMPSRGCPIVALGVEAGRGPEAYRNATDLGTQRLIDLLSQGFNDDPSEAHAKATGLLTTLVGTIVLARSASSKSSMMEILSAGRRVTELFWT